MRVVIAIHGKLAKTGPARTPHDGHHEQAARQVSLPRFSRPHFQADPADAFGHFSYSTTRKYFWPAGSSGIANGLLVAPGTGSHPLGLARFVLDCSVPGPATFQLKFTFPPPGVSVSLTPLNTRAVKLLTA